MAQASFLTASHMSHIRCTQQGSAARACAGESSGASAALSPASVLCMRRSRSTRGGVSHCSRLPPAWGDASLLPQQLCVRRPLQTQQLMERFPGLCKPADGCSPNQGDLACRSCTLDNMCSSYFARLAALSLGKELRAPACMSGWQGQHLRHEGHTPKGKIAKVAWRRLDRAQRRLLRPWRAAALADVSEGDDILHHILVRAAAEEQPDNVRACTKR